MSKGDLFMMIEAGLILSFVGYMWWKSKMSYCMNQGKTININWDNF